MKQEIQIRINQINNGIVPNGYKKTDFGIFPIDWDLNIPLAKLGNWDRGKGIPGDKLGIGNVKCIGYGDIYTKYNVHFENAMSFTDEATANGSNKFSKGTLFFTGTGETAEEIGKCVCYNGDEDIYVGGDIITFKSNKVNPMFLAFQQNQWWQIKQKFRLAQGHSVVHIHQEDLKTLIQAYPKDIKEQERIAEILMEGEKEVDLQQHYIQKLETRKSALMQKLFIHKKEDTFFKDLYLEAGEGGTPSTEKDEFYINGTIPFIKIEHLFNKYIYEVDTKITEKGLKNSSAWLVPKNSIIFSNGATIGAISINKIPVATKQGILGIVPKKEINVEYLYYLMSSFQFLNKVKKITTKGTMFTAYLKDLNKLKVYIPNIEEQNRISNILSTADRQIELQKQKLQLLKDRQKFLQQLLLTGIVRV